MTSDLFYATIKLVSGEEVLAKVCAFIENKEVLLILDNPIIVSMFKVSKNNIPLVKISPWMTLTVSSTHIIKRKDIITMSEIKDENLIRIHENYVSEILETTFPNEISDNSNRVINIEEARKKLEVLYLSKESRSNQE